MHQMAEKGKRGIAMATDTTVTRTNYFKVTDISRFRDIMSKTHCDLELEVWA